MLIIYIAIVSFVLLLVILQLAERNRRKLKKARQEYGLAVLKSSLELMTAVQQHRGMSIAFLNGDLSFKTKMLSKRREIQELLRNLPVMLSSTQELRPDEASLAEVVNKWEELLRTSEKQVPEVSFQQHTALVRDIIHLIGDMGEHLGLLDNEGTALAQLSNTLLLKLPLLLESIGQARALGSGYAAQKQCGSVGRIRLGFLKQRIIESYQGIEAAALADCVSSKKVADLLVTLQEQFIASENVEISPALFFQTATDAIEACLLLWKNIAQHTSIAVGKSGVDS